MGSSIIYGLSAVAALLASTQAAAVPSNLQQCGAAYYDPSQYTCYNTGGTGLCPVINGVPTKLCGNACYSEYMYTCKSSTLTPLPSDSLPFTLTAMNPSAPFNGKTIEASSEAFYIGRAPSTYCPVPAIPAAACAAGNTTVMYGSGLATTVPGGQEIYIQTTGALAFTQAHSAATYNLSSYSTGPVYEGGAFFAPNGTGWTACPVSGSQGVWQIFAKLAGLNFASDCVGFYAKVHDEPAGTVGAWQYV